MADNVLLACFGGCDRRSNKRRKPDRIALMWNGIARNDTVGERLQPLIRIFRKHAVDHRADRSLKAVKRQFPSGFDKRVSGRSDVVDKDWTVGLPSRKVGELDIDAAITVPNLA